MSTSTSDVIPGRAGTAAAAGTRSAVRATVAAVALLGVALIHLIDLPDKFEETPYLGVGYILLIVACLAAAELLIRAPGRVGWGFAALSAGSALVGYATSRTVGLPAAREDIGNWLEPLGLASLFVEAVVVLLAAVALAGESRQG